MVGIQLGEERLNHASSKRVFTVQFSVFLERANWYVSEESL